MPKKRKNKGNKLARMSEEERARYMQHRAEFELETRRRKQQLIAIFTKNKLRREEVFSRLNTVKINEKWRYVLRQIKCKELYDDVKHLSETFNRIVKLKDKTIRCLYNELNVVDDDHRRLQEAHIVLVDNLIGIYKQKFKRIHDCIYKLNDIKSKDLIELNLLRNRMREDCAKIQYNINAKHKTLNKEQSVTKTQNAVNIRNISFLEENIASNFEYQFFSKMEILWEQLNGIINEYEKITENKKKQYEFLKEQDDNHQLCTRHYPKMHSQLQNLIKSIKHDIQILSSTTEDRIAKLKTKDISMKKKIKDIKHQFSMNQMLDSLQLKKLSVSSNIVLKDLRKITEKGYTILEIIRICSPLEPLFYHFKEQSTEVVAHTEVLQNIIPRSCNKIDQFWKQYNRMKADNISLKKESEKLYLENKKLKHKLQAYLITMSGVPTLRPATVASV